MNSTLSTARQPPQSPIVRPEEYWIDMDEISEWACANRSATTQQPAVVHRLPPHPTLTEALAEPGITLVTLHETRTAGVPWRVDYDDGSHAWGVQESYLSGALWRLRASGIEGRRIKIVAYMHSGW